MRMSAFRISPVLGSTVLGPMAKTERLVAVQRTVE